MNATAPIAELKQRIVDFTDTQAVAYWADGDIDQLVSERAQFFDDLIVGLWHQLISEENRSQCALLAVGGYGRGEMMPHSDIDLLIVTPKRKVATHDIEAFLRALWDLGLEVGHSVRTPKDCKREASDLTVATALLERRVLTGCSECIAALNKALAKLADWAPDRFFRGKRDEQVARHKQYDNTDYGLEPNLKNSPGGLRDIQTGLWICLRKYETADPDDLVALGVLTELERDWLVAGRRHLWKVRFGLHLIADRKEDRLQFEFQRELARRLGFVDTDAQRGVERFMGGYYRHVLELREVNDILLQSFQESVSQSSWRQVIEPINERFQVNSGDLEARTGTLFEEQPGALLEAFVIMAHRRDISGVRADTIRQIRANVHRIDDAFRNDAANTRAFIALLKAPYSLVTQLTRMRRYGILGRYIPEFGRIIGQMQHDLFHIYTVDAHTMMVIRNMRRFFFPLRGEGLSRCQPHRATVAEN